MLRIFIACSLMIGGPAVADVLLLDGIEAARATSGQRPVRGTSMDRVEAAYGPPSSRHAAVGEPPITRWDYPGFVVYFEYQYVIHAVAAN